MIRKVINKIVKKPWSVKYNKSVQNSYSNATVTGNSLQGKVVCISGATGDIGKALIRRFLTEKCKVVLIGRTEEKINELCDFFQEQFEYLVIDLSVPEEIEKKYSDYLLKNNIDILINNAGVFGGAREKTFRNVSEETFVHGMNVNLKAAEILSYLTIKKCDKECKKLKIINISSICSLFNSFRYSVYGISKAGLVGLAKDINIQYGECGVMVRTILPGSVATRMGGIKLGDNIAGNNNILNRPALPEEVAALVAIYASDIGEVCVNNLVASAGEKL